MKPSRREEYSTASPSISSPMLPRKSPDRCAVDSLLCPSRAFGASLFAFSLNAMSLLSQCNLTKHQTSAFKQSKTLPMITKMEVLTQSPLLLSDPLSCPPQCSENNTFCLEHYELSKKHEHRIVLGRKLPSLNFSSIFIQAVS